MLSVEGVVEELPGIEELDSSLPTLPVADNLADPLMRRVGGVENGLYLLSPLPAHHQHNPHSTVERLEHLLHADGTPLVKPVEDGRGVPGRAVLIARIQCTLAYEH